MGKSKQIQKTKPTLAVAVPEKKPLATVQNIAKGLLNRKRK